MYKSSSKPTPSVKPPLEKLGISNNKNDLNYRLVIVLLKFLKNSTHSEAKFGVRQCMQLIADPKLLQNQAVKCVFKYLKGTATQGLILNPDPVKGIEFYSDSDFTGQWNQEDVKYPGLVLSRTGYVITSDNCPIIWTGWLKT